LKMFIFIKTLSGKTISLDVDPSDQIISLKKKIQDRENVPLEQQRLLYAGKELADENDLKSYSIGKESILHLVLKKSEQRLKALTDFEQMETIKAQSMPMQQYYNTSVGLNDELVTFKDSESKFDTHSNPQGAEYDLGRDGEFKNFSLLIGQFDAQCGLRDASEALKQKGFKVIIVTTMNQFIAQLKNVQVAWIISGMQSSVDNSSSAFIDAVVSFHLGGGGLLVWGDNDPYFAHANLVLPKLLKKKIQLIGNTPGGKPMFVGSATKSSQFAPHIITTGVVKLFEGITICYPDNLGPLKVLGTSSDGHPAVSFADNESLDNPTCGRIIVDCGWTKNYCSWKEAGTARYVSNATIWLLGLENKITTDEVPSPTEQKSPVPPVPSPTENSTSTTNSNIVEEKQQTSTTNSNIVEEKQQERPRKKSFSQKVSGFFGSKS